MAERRAPPAPPICRSETQRAVVDRSSMQALPVASSISPDPSASTAATAAPCGRRARGLPASHRRAARRKTRSTRRPRAARPPRRPHDHHDATTKETDSGKQPTATMTGRAVQPVHGIGSAPIDETDEDAAASARGRARRARHTFRERAGVARHAARGGKVAASFARAEPARPPGVPLLEPDVIGSSAHEVDLCRRNQRCDSTKKVDRGEVGAGAALGGDRTPPANSGRLVTVDLRLGLLTTRA